MMNRDTLVSYAADPLAFFAGVAMATPQGLRPFGEAMAPFQRERFQALAPSLLAIAHGQKPAVGRFWWEATKGASKDSDLALAVLFLLAFTRRPITCQVAAADQDQADELRKAAKTWLHLNPWLGQRVKIHNWKILCEVKSSEAEIVAADVAGSHGARPDVLILNELSHITKWEFAETLMDNAAKVPGGLVIVATNAGFVGSPAWKWREMARTADRWSFHQYERPAPWLDDAEVSEARQRNSSVRFLRLFYGVWSTGEGDAIDPGDIETACTQTGPHPQRLDNFAAYLACLDLGLKQDHAALVTIGIDHNAGHVHLADCESWNPKDYGGRLPLDMIEAAALAGHKRFQYDGLIYDPWQAEYMAQRLNRSMRVIEWPFSPRNKDLMATSLLQAFRNAQVILYRDEALLADFRKLAVIDRPSGYRLEARRDATGHADRANAFAMGLPTALAWINDLRNWEANRDIQGEYFVYA